MRHWFIFLTVFQVNYKDTCIFILNFKHIEYMLKVFSLIMWNLVFRLSCKSVQFFNLLSVFLKLKLCKFIVLLHAIISYIKNILGYTFQISLGKSLVFSEEKNVFDSNVKSQASTYKYIIGLLCDVCQPDKLKKNEITGIF